MQAIDPQELYPFELDPFQLQAIAALQAGKSVVVCAPTGSGKTLIGEYAIHAALADHRRVFYTTPLKALSNQKLRDFRHQFGDDNVGLLTGDTSVNRDAPILVMTTEIFRNMLYGTPIGEVGTSLTDVEVVVLDECHYMNDRQRGTVWEESIVYCPAEVQLVALSATVANSQQLTDWIHKVHGDTELIYSDFRPVPLEHSFCNNKGFFPLLDSSNQKINPRLKPLTNKPPSKEERHKIVPPIGAVISHLRQRDMLPAIYFIFSRRGCDKSVTDLGNVSLVNAEESLRLKPQIDAFIAANPEIGKPSHIDALYRGIAAHHAGILPAWKGFVEELFQQGLIKVVFATETLAAGINMPARTTVISSISKRTDRGHRLLNASEFLQMAGRAGRRGMDEVGYVVTVQTPFEGAKEAAHLATSSADPLVSQFAPSYGMVMNLLQTHSLDQARDLVERSFGQYLADLNLAPQIQNLESVMEQIAKLEHDLANIDLKQLEVYDKLRDRLREEKRLLKMLAQQSEEMRLNDLASYAPYLLSGSPLTIRTNKGLIIHTVLAAKVQGSGQFPWFVCLGRDNRWYTVGYKDIVQVGSDLLLDGDIDYPAKLPLRLGQSLDGDETSLAIAQKITPLPDPELAPEVIKQQARVMAIESEMNQHPVSKMSDRSMVFKKVKRLEVLQRQSRFQEDMIKERRQKYWQKFMSLVNILQEYDYLQGTQPTKQGEIVASLRGENELWLSLVLKSGELDNLLPHHLATVCAAIVSENSRPDNWINFGLSPIVRDVLDRLGKPYRLRYKLIQVQKEYLGKYYDKSDYVLNDFPAWLDYELTGLVEQWALGMEWFELCQNTNLDEGDIVRLMRRTIDLLYQIPHVPNLPSQIYQAAKQAAQMIDRFPVNEVI
ncbi:MULTISPECIES: DEAD/DEAH box helicase [Pseudanabaena]|uniref:DEAD/DEAH box helicase n=1 Tax=Pseudanabaena TaxID=1152 RepID=UPI00247ABE95|nr:MULTISPECIES: DEAD/DEAH box helicase [Pseudanabaena]MEA5487425.1 DEAD/DEAH box helicase [Pseudanabaena sp. CCNP1317]WGS73143.1 DEAD/DEAH box helicase [Pseudanabaena galeata CCNP1313]